MAAVVCLTDRRRSHLATLLQRAGHHVYPTYTADHAVCLCVQHFVDAVVLDQALFLESDGWSIAQSIKGVRPSIRVVLITEAALVGKTLPKSVDAIVHADEPDALRAAVEGPRARQNKEFDDLSESDTIQ